MPPVPAAGVPLIVAEPLALRLERHARGQAARLGHRRRRKAGRRHLERQGRADVGRRRRGRGDGRGFVDGQGEGLAGRTPATGGLEGDGVGATGPGRGGTRDRRRSRRSGREGHARRQRAGLGDVRLWIPIGAHVEAERSARPWSSCSTADVNTGVFAVTTCSRTEPNDSRKNGSFAIGGRDVEVADRGEGDGAFGLVVGNVTDWCNSRPWLVALVNETVPERAPDPEVSDTVAVNVTGDPAGTVPLGDAVRLTAVVARTRS